MRILSVLLAASFVMAVPLGASPTVDRSVPTKRTEVPPTDPVARAINFLAALDDARMFEKAYAERLLRETDVIRASDLYEGELRTVTDMMRVIALWGADRSPEAMVAADAIFARGETIPEMHSIGFALAANSDAHKAVVYLERAEKDLITPAERATFKSGIDTQLVSAVSQPLAQARDRAAQARFAEGLLKFDWPGEIEFARHDSQRMTALKGRLARGDVAGARTLARQVADPSAALELLVVKAYDPLVDATDRVARFAALVGTEDRRSSRALEAKPDDLKLILARAQFLRSVGREGDALALLMPHSGDMAAVAKGGSDAFWIVDQASYALSALGRRDEAMALMRRLLALDLDKHPELISMAINSTAIMNGAGRHRESAAFAEDLFRRHAGKASKYGLMWMWEGAACGHATGGNLAAAKPWIARLKADPDANRSALMRALLCTNDLDGAAAQMIERLNGDDAGDMMVAVQDFTIAATRSAHSHMLDERLRQVVGRPDVAAAIASKGRILKLPVSRTYLGMF